MAVEIKKGQKVDLTKGNPNLKNIVVGLGWSANNGVDLDTAAFLTGADGKVASDDDFVFYGNLKHKSGAVEHSGDRMSSSGGDVEQIQISLPNVPATITKISITATIYEADERKQNFSQVHNAYIRLVDKITNDEVLRFNLSNFSVETAVVVAEIYRYKGEWKFNAVSAGFSGGLAALCKNFGVDVFDKPEEPKSSAPVQNKTPARAPMRLDPPNVKKGPMRLDPPTSNQTQQPRHSVSSTLPPGPPQKVELKKGQKISLVKTGDALGEIVINLNWNQRKSQPKSSGLLENLSSIWESLKGSAIDLDLACLYELKNGKKGVVQALGNCFGSFSHEPYIVLDGDDRTGSVATGETIRVNGKYINEIKRILVFTFIYAGVANWQEVDGVVTVKCPGSPNIIVKMDEYGSKLPNCGIALMENQGGTFSVEKIVKFYKSTAFLDQDFNWGLRWISGSK